MNQDTLTVKQGVPLPVTRVHTLVVGSGAAGLSAAVQLHNQGIEDVLIVTEGLKMGTSINTGSDKQTYYKGAICGDDQDAPLIMAQNYFEGGSMHGDLALVEAAVSTRAFLNLVSLGVPFPQDAYGQFIGYKTDHDPRQRATSIGPYTSREMCRALIREVRRRKIAVHEKRLVVSLLTDGEGRAKRVVGALAVDRVGSLTAYAAENVVLAVGGPGGLYETSVYPKVHTGAIGLALMAGAKAQGLPEGQYGLASVAFRWNVSGTYMQVVPRFISTDADGGNPREFMRDYFGSMGEMNSMVFLKGYQWPFDTRKIPGGSSIIDILVYIETVRRGRRVFLDFRVNPEGFAFDALSAEARTYLEKSKALQATPIARLRHMNPGAIALYQDHAVDITREPLEIAVCAQHNNGGLAGNHWWESTTIRHLFPIGEVNGSHGVARPGGSALNAGQVGALRAAEFIANVYPASTGDARTFERVAKREAARLMRWIDKSRKATRSWQSERKDLQARMSRAGAHVRSLDGLSQALKEAEAQWAEIEAKGCGAPRDTDVVHALTTRQLCFAHRAYLAAMRFQVRSGVGSRGSAMVTEPRGQRVHPKLTGAEWRFAREESSYREKVLESVVTPDGKVRNRWVKRRPIPESDLWFETAWAAYRAGGIYRP